MGKKARQLNSEIIFYHSLIGMQQATRDVAVLLQSCGERSFPCLFNCKKERCGVSRFVFSHEKSESVNIYVLKWLMLQAETQAALRQRHSVARSFSCSQFLVP